ncbi:MAG: GNAT family N-acetyltransferase [Myxococcota bacterium]
MSYLLRDATAADDASLGELLVEAFVSSYARKMPEVVVTEKRKAELRDVAGKRAVARVWVVEHEGRVVGTVAMWPPGSEGSEAWIAGAGDLRHLAVARGHTGKGVSKRLLDGAEDWARSQGWKGVCLHVRRGAKGVRALYESRGYLRRPEGDLDFTPDVFLEAFFLPF